MNITVIIPPPFEPVTIDQVYRQLRVDPVADTSESPAAMSHPLDDDFARNIQAARQWVETETHRALIRQTLRLSMAGWRCIRLWRPPLIEVLSVRYYDAGNELQTVDAQHYYVADGEVPELRFVDAFLRPSTYDRPDAIRVEYVAGYPPDGGSPQDQSDYAANVPTPLIEAILVGVQMLQTTTSPQDASQLHNMRRSMIGPYIVPLVT